MSQTRARPRPHTAAAPALWDEGRLHGRHVGVLSLLAVLGTAAFDLALTGRLSLFFDLTFVVLCLVAAFAVRPRDFFVVGVLPPFLMLVAVTALALTARGTIADEVDSLVQAVVSGLAHHAGGLIAGYATALLVLALRQAALRHSPVHRLRHYAVPAQQTHLHRSETARRPA